MPKFCGQTEHNVRIKGEGDPEMQIFPDLICGWSQSIFDMCSKCGRAYGANMVVGSVQVAEHASVRDLNRKEQRALSVSSSFASE